MKPNMHSSSKQLGLSLVELMVSITIGLFIALGITTLLANNLRSNTQLAAANRLQQEVRNVMSIMTRDIRRAGFWTVSENSVGIQLDINPFDSITITGSCILYSYDLDSSNSSSPTNGSNGTNELFGFKMDSGSILTRIRGSNHTCQSGSDSIWEPLTDPSLTNFSTLNLNLDSELATGTSPNVFYATGSTGANIFRRTINITLTACLRTDNSVCHTISEKVRVENDLYRPS